MSPDATYPTEHITNQLLLDSTKPFLGEIEQVPPIYSAIKVDGTAAYLKARKGKTIEMKSRLVTIKEFELTDISLPEISFRVVCSKGTYIRSLAHDFGKALKSGAYLSSLCRTRIGTFYLKDAWEIEKIVEVISNQA